MKNHHFRPSWSCLPPRLDIRHKCGSITVVAKNETRQIIGWNCKQISSVVDPTVLEPMAAREAAQLALRY